MPTINIPSRNVQLNFPDTMSDEEIQSAIEKEYPRSGEDVAFDVDQVKNAALEGQSSINPFDAMSNDDYVLYRKHLADKKTSLGDALGIAKDTFGHIIDEVGTGIGATAYTLAQGDVAKAAESAGSGMVAGTVGLTDLASKILKPAQPIPTKEDFIGKRITRLVDNPNFPNAYPMEVEDTNTEDDYKKLIESEKQRDADSVNNIYAMELTMRGAPVEEIARGFQYVDPTILAGAASTALKTGASLFSKIGAKAAAGTALRATAPSAVEQAGLSAIEGTAGAIQGAASIPSKVIQGVGQVAEAVMPGTSVGAKAAALTGAAMSDAGLTAGVIGGAKATEKVAEVVGAAARIAKQEASRSGLLEQVALDPTVSASARRLATGLAQVQPIASAAGRMAGQALKEGAKGAVVGGVIGGLAERNLEGVAAGAGAGTAFGGMFGAMHSAFDLGKEVLGRSTSRTRQQATGDINTFISTRPEIEQGAWADTMNKLVAKVGPERAASQMDAMRVAEAAGSKVRIATLDEINQGLAPGWLNVATNEIVLNPAKILADTAAHEATHALFNSVISRAFRPEIETAIYGIADPVTGQIVKPGVFDDVALGKIAEQIRDSYGKNTIAANEFQGFANTLKNSTDPVSLSEARSRIADEMTAAYTGKLFDRSRAGRFNPDRLPLVYRKVLSSIEDGVLDKFRSVLYEKGMDLGFDNVSKTFRNDKGKPIRIPEIDAIVRKAFAQKLNAKDATTAKPDLIPTRPADRVLWAKTYGGARGILNDDGTPKSQKQIDAEAAARWQDMTSRLAPLPQNELKNIEFSRDKSGKTVMTAKGQLSPSAINAILDSGALDPTAKAVLVEILNSMQNAEKSTFDTRYYGVYTRGKGGNKMVAGVKSASQNEILPYSVEINSKDGVLIRAVDMSKVRDRLATAMNKPQFKAAYSNPADAIKDLRRYMENITQINAVDSATLLGGGAKGAMKRNLFYEALGFRLRNGETLLNAPDSVINKSQNTIKSYRAERFAKLVDSGYKFGFEEATSLERATRNFQPDAFTPEALPNGEAYTNKEGWRILNKTGSKLFRTYDDTGKLIGVYDSKDKAVKSAFNAAIKDEAIVLKNAEKANAEMRFQSDENYRGTHKAPTGEFGEGSLDAMNKTYPDDIYSSQGWRFYGDGASLMDKEAHKIITTFRGKPDATVTVYRSVPKGTATEINPSDWVTTVKGYAKMHGERFDNGMDILSKKVKASELFTEGNSMFEFGWSPKEDIRFQPVTPEQDAAFLAAAKVGDVDTAQRLRSFAVKQNEDLVRAIENALKTEFYKVAEEKGGNSPEAEAAYEKYMPFRQKLRNAEEDTLYPNQTRISFGPIIEEFQNKYSNSFDESRKRWDKRGEKVSDNENLGGVFKATGSGVLFRGISIDDFNRIKKTGFIDTDFRSAISNQEGINLTPDVRTAAAYLPTNSDGVIIAIDTNGLDLYNIGADSYIRSFDKIPVEKIVSATAPVFKSAEGTYYTQNKGPITYDNAGNIIPLSQRFNQASSDIRFQPPGLEQSKPNASSINFDQQGLDNSPIRSILGGSLKFNPKKVNEKYYTEATKAAKAYGAGTDFIQSRQSEVSGQVRDQMDRLRSEKLRSDDAILQQFIDAFPSHKVKQGGEHITYIPDDGDFVLKFTKPSDESGVGFTIDEDIGQGFDQKEFRRLGFRHAAVSEYIARTANFSKRFDIPWQVTEIVQNQLGQPVIVSMMKKIEGDVLTRDKADLKVIRDYMAKRGFKQLAEGPMTYHKNYGHIPESTYYNANTGELISDVEPRNFVRTKSGKVEPVDLVMNIFNPKYDIRYQPDPTSPNILNGSDGSRIIKSNSGKYRVYLATGALAGIKDTLESAQKLIETKQTKSYAPN